MGSIGKDFDNKVRSDQLCQFNLRLDPDRLGPWAHPTLPEDVSYPKRQRVKPCKRVARAMSSHTVLATLLLKADKQGLNLLNPVIYDLLKNGGEIELGQ
ncbi:hypothetical protein HW571_07780 [Agrobacterium genomosp. 3]|uniref:hypothetical protein n=1 Tax=Agrobacterium tomkonis TaxID=1183410 RepID=UPI001CD864A6|nr:hypothetical protein [Agrobacterium tomkonis]MCA1875923.1 hypothetical protein [Agrobacterium tumefaciens]MCA1891854.1 hypothetical protein [Agrobacterium tomkonis]